MSPTGVYDSGVTDKTEISRLVYGQQTATADLALLFDDLQGEETDQTAALEEFIAESSDNTLELLAAWIVELDGRMALAKVQADRLRDVLAVASDQKGWALARIRDVLNARKVRKCVAGTFSFGLRKGVMRVVQEGEFDYRETGPGYTRTTTTRAPDKAAILAQLKSGGGVPGFALVRGPEGVSVK